METFYQKSNTIKTAYRKIFIDVYHLFAVFVFVTVVLSNIGLSSGKPYQPLPPYASTAFEDQPRVASPSSQIQSSAVGDLLTSLFRETIYNRIENLLLDPGKKSSEKQKIIDSAVQNYHKQKYSAPPTSAERGDDPKLSSSSSIEDPGSTRTLKNTDEDRLPIVTYQEDYSLNNQGVDISTLAGIWFILWPVIKLDVWITKDIYPKLKLS